MSHIYNPVEAEVRNPELREAREREYDLRRLVLDGEVILRLTGAIDSFIANKCGPGRSSEGEDVTLAYYEAELTEQLGKSKKSTVYTGVEINVATAIDAEQKEGAEEPTVKEYQVYLVQTDRTGELLAEDDYLVEVNYDGTAYVCLRRRAEGIAEMLRHEDPLFIRMRQWHAATSYEAESFRADLEHMEGLELEVSDKMV